MKQFKKKISSLLSTPNAFLVGFALILVMATFSRFYRLSVPATYYFDEVYHALTSKLIARNDVRAYEWWNEPAEPSTAVDWLHPPLAKYTQALGMRLFGENSFGWRVSSAVFGVWAIGMTAILAHVFFRDKGITLLATLLVSLDGLLLSQSRIAMNDIHVTFFILATAAAYGVYRHQIEKHPSRHTWLLVTGILAGLSMGTKWSGVYILIAVGIAEVLRIATHTVPHKRARLIHVLRMSVFLGLVPVCMYIGSYTHMFLQGKSLVCTGTQVTQGVCYCSQDSSLWVQVLSRLDPLNKLNYEAMEAKGGCKRLISHFNELHRQIWWYQTNLKATHSYQSTPIQWILNMRPVWQHVDYSQNTLGIISHIYDVGNPLLFWIGLLSVISILLFFLISLGMRMKKRTANMNPLVSWRVGFLLLVYFILWAPWTFSPRIMFFYHYAPAVPFLSILTAVGAVTLWKKYHQSRVFILLGILTIALTYVVLYPINTGYPMSPEYFTTIFSLFPSWK